MAEKLAAGFWLILALYAAVGIGFSVYFVFRGAGRVDPVAREGTWGFRILIFPGSVALWPILMARIWKKHDTPPLEKNAHRLNSCHRRDGRE